MGEHSAGSAARKAAIVAAAVVLFAAFPRPAWANAGTPLMWAGFLHLFVGNLFVGIFEGLVIGLAFRVAKIRAVGLMIVANYFSAWIGCWLLDAVARRTALDLYTAWPFFWKMALLAYLVTLVLELPFVALCFWKKERWFAKAAVASVIVQTISYALLFGWYWSASGTTLYTQTDVVKLSDMSLPEGVALYYIAADGDVHMRHLGRSDDVKVFDLNSTRPNDCLLVKRSREGDGRWDLVATVTPEGRNRAEFVTVRKSVASVVAPSTQSEEESADRIGPWSRAGRVPKLGVAGKSAWQFTTGFWPVERLWGQKEDSRSRTQIGFETPVVQWPIRYATHLPSDTVIFQLGEDQICIFHPETKKLALVVKGREPVAVMDSPGESGKEDGRRDETGSAQPR